MAPVDLEKQHSEKNVLKGPTPWVILQQIERLNEEYDITIDKINQSEGVDEETVNEIVDPTQNGYIFLYCTGGGGGLR